MRISFDFFCKKVRSWESILRVNLKAHFIHFADFILFFWVLTVDSNSYKVNYSIGMIQNAENDF